MKIILLVLSLILVAPMAFAKKDCEELKAEIDAKFQAKGVKSYTLGIINTADVKDEKIVGSCNGGAQKITYKRD